MILCGAGVVKFGTGEDIFFKRVNEIWFLCSTIFADFDKNSVLVVIKITY